MKEKEGITKGIGQKLAVSLLSAAIIAIVTTLVPGGWSAVFAFSKKAFTAATSWLGSEVPTPIWLLLILGLITFAAIVAVGILIYLATRKEEQPVLPTEGIYFGIKWRWRSGRYGVQEPVSFCPRCDLQLHPENRSFYGGGRTGFKCDHCNWESQEFDFSSDVLQDKVIRSIQKDYRAALSDPAKD